MPGPFPATAEPLRADRPAPERGSPARPAGDDEFLAGLLIRMWALASGRTLRSDIRPEQLDREELIGFWADDLAPPPPGRHALPAAGPAGAAR